VVRADVGHNGIVGEAFLMKVLISAYACNPFRGSEEGVGWGWVTAIARSHDVCVLTADYHREDIEKALAEDPVLRGRVRPQHG
jgi:hypothetical protein